MNIKIDSLNKTILKCKKCPRLVNFVKKISTEKRKQNINEFTGENQLQVLVQLMQKF